MFHLFRQLADFFDLPERLQVLGLALMVLVGSALDILGVGLILPLVIALSDPQALLDNQLIGPVLRDLGVIDQGGLLVLFSIAVVGVFVLKNVYLALQWRVVYGFVFSKMVSVATQLMDGYMRASYTFHMQHNSAHLIRNTNTEVQRLFQGVVQPTVVLAADLVLTAGIIGLLVSVQSLATLGVVIILGAAGIGLSLLVHGRLDRAGKLRSERQGQMIQWVTDGLTGLKEIKVLGREAHFVDGFRHSTAAFGGALRENQLNLQYPRLTIETAAVIAGVALLFILYNFGGDLDNILPIFSLFAVAMVRLMPSFSRIVSAINSIRFSGPSVEIVHGELEKTSQSAQTRLRSDATNVTTFHRQVEIKGLTFRYPCSTGPAVSDVTLTIRRGKAVAFVGSSGAGKTTLVNLTLGLLQPSSGAILVDGMDIRENIPGWQKRIGYIPQDIYLSNDTLRRNIAFGLPDHEIDDAAIWRSLEASQIGAFVKGLENGLDTVVGDRGARLSGGERQRIGIARALYHDPEVVVLDEATSSLDYETERDVMSAIYQVAEAKTVIIITHRISTVQRCDTIHILDSGRVVGSGTFQELLSTNPKFQDLVRAGEMFSTLQVVQEH